MTLRFADLFPFEVPSMRTIKIRRELLEYLLQLARSAYPNEFAGFLREKDGIFEEVLIAPNQYPAAETRYFLTTGCSLWTRA